MSAGGVFRLLANDGKADRMILATELLNNRIKQIMSIRASQGHENIAPSLADIEKTHILYVNAHYKPHAAIGCEYNKVSPTTGTQSFGQTVQFSIPLFGDFFNDMVVLTTIGQVAGVAGTTPVQGSIVGGTRPFPLNGFDAAGAVLATAFYNLVDPAGRVLVAGVAVNPAAGVAYSNFVRYCEYPGDRLFAKVQFDVNGNPLDEYTDVVPLFTNKFLTAPHKRDGRDRLVGQEVGINGYGALSFATVVDANSTATPLGIGKQNAGQSNQTVGLYTTAAGVFASATTVSQSALVNLNAGATQLDIHRASRKVFNGPQTPKPVQPQLDIWSPLCFWYCSDVRQSVPSVAIPYGQRFITITLAAQASILFEERAIYLETISDATASPFAGGALSERVKTYVPLAVPLLGVGTASITKMELYINNIFVNPEIHEIYIQRIGFTLIRVHRQHIVSINQTSSNDQQLTQLKWPIEYMFIGVRPSWNTDASNLNQWRDWHRMTRTVDATSDFQTLAEIPGNGLVAAVGSRIGQVDKNKYWLPVPTINQLQLTTHGVPVYQLFNDVFYANYLPFRYGGIAVTTPDDPGALMVNFALFPGSYQPSGHLNLSRSRETFLRTTTSYVGANTPSTLQVDALAINFLMIADGSAVLRYTT